MTGSAMCDNCGEHGNPNRMFELKEPHSVHRLDFCNKKCLTEYLNREWGDYGEIKTCIIKRERYLESISEIVDKLIDEDLDLFRSIDRETFLNFILGIVDKLPDEIAEDELYRRIRKIMVVEAMSKIFED